MERKKRVKNNLTKRENSDVFLKKHVGLIHCENKLTLMQRKICNILLFNALDNIHDQEIHEISLRQLCSLVGYNSNDSKPIKESIKGLISVVMEWNLLEDNKFLNEENFSEDAITWNASSLLAGASIRAGVIRYSYSPQIKSVLSSLDIYGRINLFVQSKFNSSYSLVLYENCVRFKNIKQTSWFPIELFRSLMGVSGDKYSSFKEFNRNVINVAVNEVQQKSDIYIEPRFKKLGRNVTAIQFTIRENENYVPSFRKTRTSQVATYSQQSSLIEVLISEYGLSKKQATEILSNYSYEYIIEKLNLVKAKTNIDNNGAYLVSALRNDYKNNVKKLQQPKIIENNSYIRESKEATEVRFLRDKYTSYKLKVYIDNITQQSESIQSEVKKKFEEYLLLPKNIGIYRHYKRKQLSLSSPFVGKSFIVFIEENCSHLIRNLLTFDEYITSEEHATEADELG